jgi:thioredoxin reductase (NADPH)
MEEQKVWDVVIVGGGAAGMSAAIYTCRKKMSTVVITVDVGGQNLLTESEENYPGYLETSGPKLMGMFQEQAVKFGSDFVFGKAVKLEKEGDLFKVTMGNGETYLAKIIILGYGKVARELGVPGEKKFLGRGVHTCATCDAPFTKGKTVAVAGGGNSALEAAELLSKFATKVYLIHRRDEFRADPITVEKIKAIPNIEMVLSTEIREVLGEQKVRGILVEDAKTNVKREITLDSVFIEIGYILDSAWLGGLVKTNEIGEVVINERCETSQPGIFAAGDVTNTPYKQTVISAGEGAKAGLSAYNYARVKEGKVAIKQDWG